MEKTVKKRRHTNAFEIICFIVLALFSFTLVFALLWAFMNTFKTHDYFMTEPLKFPKPFVFDNYVTAFNAFNVDVKGHPVYIETMLANSLMYAVGCAFLHTASCCITAYAAARFPFKFSKVIYAIVIVTMILPIVGTLPAEIAMTQKLGIWQTWFGPYILKSHFLSVYFLVFYAAFQGVPKAFSEAAKIDGANNLSILVQIMLPLVFNTFMLIILINFITFWNDYYTPLIYLKSYPTLAYGLQEFWLLTKQDTASSTVKLAACMIVFVPIFVLFIYFSDKLIGNISMGGIKE